MSLDQGMYRRAREEIKSLTEERDTAEEELRLLRLAASNVLEADRDALSEPLAQLREALIAQERGE